MPAQPAPDHHMTVSAIVAVAANGVIGDGDDIPWRLSADLKYFKRLTTGHHIIMGRKTYASLGRPLPNRTNVVLTRDMFFTAHNVLVAHTIEEALELAYDQGETEAFVIGGGEIYALSQAHWDRLYLTRVACEAPGEVYFPEVDLSAWQLVSREPHLADERNEYNYVFEVYERPQAHDYTTSNP